MIITIMMILKVPKSCFDLDETRLGGTQTQILAWDSPSLAYLPYLDMSVNNFRKLRDCGLRSLFHHNK